uniref:Light-harvest protein n=1 Tax=Griffithsia japonica TaxID=83288 RepID=Q7XY90_GRIJA|nr:light-harvest protein [Griffithsia japonica]
MNAFVPTLPLLSRSSLGGASLSVAPRASAPATVSMSERSASVPFLKKPENLPDTLIGYTGFDPLNFTGRVDYRWMQEAEIKHGRVSMLAVLGMLVQEFIHLPAKGFENPLATEAFFQVPSAGLFQIFLFCGFAELYLHKGKLSPSDMFSDGATPGELGFNPMNLDVSDSLRLKEIKNGRLAMCASGGFIHSMLLYKTPIIAQLLDFQPLKVPM